MHIRRHYWPSTTLLVLPLLALSSAFIFSCKPGESSVKTDQDARLHDYLETFDKRSDFVDDLCVKDLCEVSFFDLPASFLIRRGGIFAPHDYYSLWIALENNNFVAGKRVLDLGTGAGPFALIAAHFGAEAVVGTDINSLALADAERNAARMGWSSKMDFRLVSLESPEAYSVMNAGENFDIILSNPPELDEIPRTGDVEDYAEKDPGYQFVLSMLDGLPKALSENGQLVLLYAGASGVPVVQERVRSLGLEGTIDLTQGSESFVDHRPLEGHEGYGPHVPLIRIGRSGAVPPLARP